MNLKTVPTQLLAVTLSLAMSQVAASAALAAPHVVEPGQVAATLIEKAHSRQAKIELFQQALAAPEVQAKARSLGMDSAKLGRAIPHLSDGQLAELAARATRAPDLVAGHRRHGHHHPDAALLVIGLALLLAAVIVLAVADEDDDYYWETDW